MGGYELETNFIVMDDAMGVEDFLLGCNFLRAYRVLVDLTSMKMVVRTPVKPIWHHAHTQVGDASMVTPVALDSDLVLQPFERAVVEAKLITNELEPLIFQNVVLNAAIADASLHNVVFLEDSVATVSEAGHVFISVMNLTSNPQRIRKGTRMGNIIPVSLVYQAVPQWTPTQQYQQTVADNDQFAFANRIYEEMNYNTDSQLTSSEFEFLSSTDPTEEGPQSAKNATYGP